MTGLLLALAGAYGVHLLYTSLAFGWSGVAPGPQRAAVRPQLRPRLRGWLNQAGLAQVRTGEFIALVVALLLVGTAIGYALFGAAVPAVAVGGFAASFPVVAYRSRRRTRRETAQEAWPGMIEEIRVLTASVGYSIPQALFDVGQRGPTELRAAFEAAHREWLLTTDFGATLDVLKRELADPTADVACETLLVAHQIGGTDLDRRLAALVDDRLQEVRGRKDARAKQAGARFARGFVLLVPLGMAFAGMSVGTGREAFRTPAGQVAVLCGILLVATCWLWAGRIMRVPDEERVFAP